MFPTLVFRFKKAFKEVITYRLANNLTVIYAKDYFVIFIKNTCVGLHV